MAMTTSTVIVWYICFAGSGVYCTPIDHSGHSYATLEQCLTEMPVIARMRFYSGTMVRCEPREELFFHFIW